MPETKRPQPSRTGFYLAVTGEGEVGAGDGLRAVSHDPESVSVSTITRLYVAETYGRDDARAVRRALTVEALPDGWKQHLEEKLRRAGA